jgi:hypothetical protein
MGEDLESCWSKEWFKNESIQIGFATGSNSRDILIS